MNRLLTLTVAFSTLFVAGCSKSPEKTSPPAGATTTTTGSAQGLKEIIKEDLVVGKPSEFVPKMAPASLGDRLYVRYKGYFINGATFDRNDSDGNVYAVTLGNAEVIKGWDEGLIGMQIGGKRKLSVPWIKGYGEAGDRNIPAKTDLFFDVELVDMVKYKMEKTYDIIDRVKGTGREVKRGDTVTVDYEMRAAGQSRIIDSTKIQGGKTMTFQVGTDEMIIAVEDACVGMKLGGVREARLPAGLCRVQAQGLAGVPSETVWYVKLKLLAVK